MDVRYKRLFSITCLHLYFAETPPVCRNLMLRPTRACAQALYNHKLLFRATPGGGEVLYGQQDESLLESLREPLVLAFTLHSTDPYFINYTDLSLEADPLTPSNAVYYFTNLTDTPNERALFGKTRSLLHPKRQVTTQDRLAVKPPVFTLPPLADTDVKIVDQTGETVWDGKTAGVAAQPYRTPGATIIEPGDRVVTGGPAPAGSAGSPAPLAVDMRGQPPGRYDLFVGEERKDAFYLSDLVPSAVWGLVEIVVDGPASALSIAEAYRLVEPGGAVTSRDFTVCFNNRETIWRYLITPPSPDGVKGGKGHGALPENGKDAGEIGVSGKVTKERQDDGSMTPLHPPQPIAFTEVKTTEEGASLLADGRKALVFESATAIPLLQRPAEAHHFSFNDGVSSYFLPYASSNLVKPEPPKEAGPDGSATVTVVSEIHAYL